MMDLLQVILPQPSDFRILLKDDEKIRIIKYEKIDINFCDRTVFINGKGKKIQSPLITYIVKIDKKSKKQMQKLFEDNGKYGSTIGTIKARIEVGKYRYVFNVEISARPDMEKSWFLHEKYQDDIKICLKIENTSISLFDRANEAYEKYSRFELLDL